MQNQQTLEIIWPLSYLLLISISVIVPFLVPKSIRKDVIYVCLAALAIGTVVYNLV